MARHRCPECVVVFDDYRGFHRDAPLFGFRAEQTIEVLRPERLEPTRQSESLQVWWWWMNVLMARSPNAVIAGPVPLWLPVPGVRKCVDCGTEEGVEHPRRCTVRQAAELHPDDESFRTWARWRASLVHEVRYHHASIA